MALYINTGFSRGGGAAASSSITHSDCCGFFDPLTAGWGCCCCSLGCLNSSINTDMDIEPTHSVPMALVLCDVILSMSVNPANTGRAAVLYTAQLLCLCWLDWQT